MIENFIIFLYWSHLKQCKALFVGQNRLIHVQIFVDQIFPAESGDLEVSCYINFIHIGTILTISAASLFAKTSENQRQGVK